MDMSLKQRLIGGAVIVVLAVIFVPMLLDGSGRKERLTRDVELPADPVFTFEQSGKQSGSSISGQGTTDGGLAVQPQPTIVTQPASAPRPESAKPESADKEPLSKEPAGKALESAKVAGLGSGKGWVVQVGSFSKENNALVLRDKLKAAGFKAFIEPGGDTAARVFRVRVGPQAERDEANDLQARLLAEQKLKGIVLSFR